MEDKIDNQPDLPKVLFWDIPGGKPDYQKYKDRIIARVFSRGSMEDIGKIILYYGKPQVKLSLTNAPHLDEDILYLSSAILQTPLTEFKCYITKQYRKIF